MPWATSQALVSSQSSGRAGDARTWQHGLQPSLITPRLLVVFHQGIAYRHRARQRGSEVAGKREVAHTGVWVSCDSTERSSVCGKSRQLAACECFASAKCRIKRVAELEVRFGTATDAGNGAVVHLLHTGVALLFHAAAWGEGPRPICFGPVAEPEIRGIPEAMMNLFR